MHTPTSSRRHAAAAAAAAALNTSTTTGDSVGGGDFAESASSTPSSLSSSFGSRTAASAAAAGVGGPGVLTTSLAGIFAQQFFHRPLDCELMADREERLLQRGRERRNEKRLSAGVIASLRPPTPGGSSQAAPAGKGRRNSFTLLFPGAREAECDAETRHDSREKLAEQLRQLETAGLPRPLQDHSLQLNSVFLDLEPSWDRVVAQSSITSAKMLKQQAAIWELFQTEINILRHLRTVIDVYISVIQHLQSSCGLLTEVSTDRLFPGLSLVYLAHRCLWADHLRPALLSARRTGQRIRPGQLASGFLRFGEIFQPCADYCLQIGDAKDYLRGLEKSETFSEFVKWAQRVSCRNYNAEDGTVDLQLKSLLTMPLQRITKYGLLLQEVLRHTEDNEERLQLETMIAHTADFCSRLNTSYQLKSDQEELRGVADRLEDAKLQEWRESLGDEAANLLDRYRLDLTRPMPHNGQQRRKLCEGELRLRDEKGKWSDAKCLLFTDLLLLTKCSKRSNLRLLRPPIPLERLLIHRVSDSSAAFLLVSLTSFSSVDCLLYLAGADQRASDDWIERLVAARAAVQAQALPQLPAHSRHSLPPQADGLHQQPSELLQQQQLSRVLQYTHSSSDIDALVRGVCGQTVDAGVGSGGGGAGRNSATLGMSRLQTEHDVYSSRCSPPPLPHRLRPA